MFVLVPSQSNAAVTLAAATFPVFEGLQARAGGRTAAGEAAGAAGGQAGRGGAEEAVPGHRVLVGRGTGEGKTGPNAGRGAAHGKRRTSRPWGRKSTKGLIRRL